MIPSVPNSQTQTGTSTPNQSLNGRVREVRGDARTPAEKIV